ncbi:MAG TPA: acyltransferase [Polyangia bacterium]|nr:acyltransferase [Polyangia bacterium]
MSAPHHPTSYRPGVYQPALDGLRALSISAVLLYHDDLLIRGGYLGVDIFFVLSGFLITSLLFDEWRQRGRINLRNFYLRRALRLFPALAALLAVATAFALAFPRAPQSPHILRGVGYSLIYMTNWVNGRDPFLLGPLGHTWSLAVEEQFYLFWPVILIGLVKVFPRLRGLIVATVGLALASAAWRFTLFSLGSTPWRLYNGTDSRADSLLIGCAAALAMTDRRFLEIVRDSRLGRWLALAAAALLVFLMKGTPLEWSGYDRGMFLVVAIAVAIIVVVILANPDLLATRILSTRPLVWLGRLSYSLYLWHMPIFGFIKPGSLGISPTTARIARLVFAFAAAIGSYLLIERPFLRLKTRLSPKAAQAPERVPVL